MPMSYLYGKRFVGPITGMVRSLRQELYTEPYNEINWTTAKNTVAKVSRLNIWQDRTLITSNLVGSYKEFVKIKIIVRTLKLSQKACYFRKISTIHIP